MDNQLISFCRFHTVQEFNKGVYDYIIATDEVNGEENDEKEEAEAEEECESTSPSVSHC